MSYALSYVSPVLPTVWTDPPYPERSLLGGSESPRIHPRQDPGTKI